MKELVKPILLGQETEKSLPTDCCGGNCDSNSKSGLTGNCGYNTNLPDESDDEILF